MGEERIAARAADGGVLDICVLHILGEVEEFRPRHTFREELAWDRSAKLRHEPPARVQVEWPHAHHCAVDDAVHDADMAEELLQLSGPHAAGGLRGEARLLATHVVPFDDHLDELVEVDLAGAVPVEALPDLGDQLRGQLQPDACESGRQLRDAQRAVAVQVQLAECGLHLLEERQHGAELAEVQEQIASTEADNEPLACLRLERPRHLEHRAEHQALRGERRHSRLRDEQRSHGLQRALDALEDGGELLRLDG
mmetsp:Transcript_78389/g.226664  ORF Transcript_78389/g.226664 Transcript_78389/m.226664 type:complete len:254 (-) Transcript_78389:433-1194(-)